MEKPLKLRLRPVEVEAIQYSGHNSDEIINWVTESDPTISCRRDMQPLRTTPIFFGSGGDGCTAVPVVERLIIDIYSNHSPIYLYIGDWLFKDKIGRFSRHENHQVKAKYERIWPEPLPGI